MSQADFFILKTESGFFQPFGKFYKNVPKYMLKTDSLEVQLTKFLNNYDSVPFSKVYRLYGEKNCPHSCNSKIKQIDLDQELYFGQRVVDESYRLNSIFMNLTKLNIELTNII